MCEYVNVSQERSQVAGQSPESMISAAYFFRWTKDVDTCGPLSSKSCNSGLIFIRDCFKAIKAPTATLLSDKDGKQEKWSVGDRRWPSPVYNCFTINDHIWKDNTCKALHWLAQSDRLHFSCQPLNSNLNLNKCEIFSLRFSMYWTNEDKKSKL